jgi:glutamate--cysteine ligase catalytic subunit
MGRAQQRDASVSGRFYFRKDVFPPNQSWSTSTASSHSSSGANTPANGIAGQKEKKLRNCYPSLPLPGNAVHLGCINDEYEEMSMNEIMNGKVGFNMGIRCFYFIFLFKESCLPGPVEPG